MTIIAENKPGEKVLNLFAISFLRQGLNDVSRTIFTQIFFHIANLDQRRYTNGSISIAKLHLQMTHILILKLFYFNAEFLSLVWIMQMYAAVFQRDETLNQKCHMMFDQFQE